MTATEHLAALQRTGTLLDEALALYDALPPVTVEQALGAWVGSGLETGHPMDGLLEAYGWHGKRFDAPDEAHPLVFADDRGRFAVNPALVPMGLVDQHGPRLRGPRVAAVARRSLRAATTRKPRARLRMMEHRGVVSATMSYDALPINDHFRLVDDDTLLGVMDLRAMSRPFCFVLRREP
ncbi:DUF4334 domain-containing protein [Nocardioides marmoraquaticus]